MGVVGGSVMEGVMVGLGGVIVVGGMVGGGDVGGGGVGVGVGVPGCPVGGGVSWGVVVDVVGDVLMIGVRLTHLMETAPLLP